MCFFFVGERDSFLFDFVLEKEAFVVLSFFSEKKAAFFFVIFLEKETLLV